MWKTFAALALGLVLAACDVSGFVPQEHQDFAKRVVSMIQNRDDAGLQSVSHPDLWPKLPPALRERMAQLFPAEQPSSITISSWKSNYANDWTNVAMVMLYKYSTREIKVTIEFRSSGARNVLTAIFLLPVSGPGSTPAQPQQQQPDDPGKSTTL
jgi:hypothetical protein